jgi:hypothetical protein
MMFPLGNWLPDQPGASEPHLRDAKNVLPKIRSYGPFRGLTAGTGYLSDVIVLDRAGDTVIDRASATVVLRSTVNNAERPQGLTSFIDVAGLTHVYAGSASALFELQADGRWLDVSRTTGGAYTTASTDGWDFAQFGDKCIATNFADEVQSTSMSTDATFEDLGGSPPRAKYVETFRDFVVLANTATSPYQVYWSGINDATSWTQGTDQSDAQSFPDGGPIQGMAVTDTLTIFQTAKIRRMQYVGPPLIMEFDVISEDRGCLAPSSITTTGSVTFFLAPDGFYMLAGDNLQPIGAEQVNEWFFADYDQNYPERVSAFVDIGNNLVYWGYASTNSMDGNPDTIIVYNWVARKWSYARVNHALLGTTYSLGYTLDGLDALTTNIDNFDVPLDDPSLTGGELALGAFSSTFQYGPFSGVPLEATLTTGDFQHLQGRRAFVSNVEVGVDNIAATVAVSARERLGATALFDAAAEQQSNGVANADAQGRFHRYTLSVPSGETWNDATFLAPEIADEGEI